MAMREGDIRRSDASRAAGCSAVDVGEAVEERRFMTSTSATETFPVAHAARADRPDTSAWPDAWLVAAVRGDPLHVESLGTLAGRYSKMLFRHCRVLVFNDEKAADLAQEAWCRVLRARHSLKPDGNFPAYLAKVATNLWRDQCRSERRAGPIAQNRLTSLDIVVPGESEAILLRDTVPDPKSLDAEKRRLLGMDLDQAIERLPPLLREVLVARFLNGESCAEIGRRHQRTVQTVSEWMRQGLAELRQCLSEADAHATPS